RRVLSQAVVTADRTAVTLMLCPRSAARLAVVGEHSHRTRAHSAAAAPPPAAGRFAAETARFPTAPFPRVDVSLVAVSARSSPRCERSPQAAARSFLRLSHSVLLWRVPKLATVAAWPAAVALAKLAVVAARPVAAPLAKLAIVAARTVAVRLVPTAVLPAALPLFPARALSLRHVPWAPVRHDRLEHARGSPIAGAAHRTGECDSEPSSKSRARRLRQRVRGAVRC